MKSLLTSNLLPSRLQYRISKNRGCSARDMEGFGLFGRTNKPLGFTLIELMVAIAIIGILFGIGVPAYIVYLEKAKVVTAVAEIKMIMTEIEAYKAINDESLPADLSVVGYQDFPDPWGNPYQYVNLEPGGGASLGPSFASVKKGTKVSVLEKRQPMGWSAAKANGLYAADGIFRKRFVESVRETIVNGKIKTIPKGIIITTVGYGGNKSLLKTYSPAYHKKIMLVGSPLMEGGLLLLAKGKGGEPPPPPPPDPPPPEGEDPPPPPDGGGGPEQAKVDANNNPLNWDFDLYSMGKDGVTHKRINQTKSLDDIIRGDNGNFIGPVSKY